MNNKDKESKKDRETSKDKRSGSVNKLKSYFGFGSKN